MKVRYYIDPETGQPHIYNHNVAESEVEEVLASPGEDRPGRDEARVTSAKRRAAACSGLSMSRIRSRKVSL